ncbi:2-dehydropantoate 2-reductase [Streptomyces sp. NPDC086182]|uniref:ketopantoate reductase family protein n=1 Tax=Streptomyces sp. NPDC086182 TaxID=3155058 RepID=UPI00341E6EAB
MRTTELTVATPGPGGVGGLIGALARDGQRVMHPAREETAAVLSGDGLHIESTRYGDFTAAVQTDTQLREPADAVFVTVEQTVLEEALDRIPAEALGDAIVVPLLNGLEHLAVLRERYPSAKVVAGTIRVEATRTAPGRIVHGGSCTNLELAAPIAELRTSSGTPASA